MRPNERSVATVDVSSTATGMIHTRAGTSNTGEEEISFDFLNAVDVEPRWAVLPCRYSSAGLEI